MATAPASHAASWISRALVPIAMAAMTTEMTASAAMVDHSRARVPASPGSTSKAPTIASNGSTPPASSSAERLRRHATASIASPPSSVTAGITGHGTSNTASHSSPGTSAAKAVRRIERVSASGTSNRVQRHRVGPLDLRHGRVVLPDLRHLSERVEQDRHPALAPSTAR